MGASISATGTSSNRVSASDGAVVGALDAGGGGALSGGFIAVAEADVVLAGAFSVLPNAGTELTGESAVRRAGGAVTTALGPAPTPPFCAPAAGPSGSAEVVAHAPARSAAAVAAAVARTSFTGRQ